jgi:hypothetical protein
VFVIVVGSGYVVVLGVVVFGYRNAGSGERLVEFRS